MNHRIALSLALLSACTEIDVAEVENELAMPQPGPAPGPAPGGPRCMLGAPGPDGTPVVFQFQQMQALVNGLQQWVAGQNCNPGDPNQKNVRDVFCNFAVTPPAGAARATGVNNSFRTTTNVSNKLTLKVYAGDKLLDSQVLDNITLDPNKNSDQNFYNCHWDCTNADPANPNAGTVMLSKAPFHSAVIKGNAGNDYLPPDGTGKLFCAQAQTQIANLGLDCEIGPGARAWRASFASMTEPKWVDSKMPYSDDTVCFPRTSGTCPLYTGWAEANPTLVAQVTSAIITSEGTIWTRDGAAMKQKCEAAAVAVTQANRDARCAATDGAPGPANPSIYAVQVSGQFVCTKAQPGPGGGGMMIDAE